MRLANANPASMTGKIVLSIILMCAATALSSCGSRAPRTLEVQEQWLIRPECVRLPCSRMGIGGARNLRIMADDRAFRIVEDTGEVQVGDIQHHVLYFGVRGSHSYEKNPLLPGDAASAFYVPLPQEPGVKIMSETTLPPISRSGIMVPGRLLRIEVRYPYQASPYAPAITTKRVFQEMIYEEARPEVCPSVLSGATQMTPVINDCLVNVHYRGLVVSLQVLPLDRRTPALIMERKISTLHEKPTVSDFLNL